MIVKNAGKKYLTGHGNSDIFFFSEELKNRRW
jgi:hypothetical protein